MAKSKFKVGDKVRILSNEIQPQFINKVGIIKKAYCTFCESEAIGSKLWLYRITVNNQTLYGVATEADLEAYG